MGLGITPKNQEYVDATAATIARNGDANHASRYAAGMVKDGFDDNYNSSKVTKTESSKDPTSFGDAFSAARAAQGDGGVFEFEGKQFTTDLASDSTAPTTSIRPPTRPVSVDKAPFVPQFPGDVPSDVEKLRDPSSYLSSLIEGSDPNPFGSPLPGDDQVADASGGNNAFLDYILGTNDGFVPQFPGDVPPPTVTGGRGGVVEQPGERSAYLDSLIQGQPIADASEQGILSGLLQTLGGGLVRGTGQSVLGASDIIESKNQTPRYIYGDAGVPLRPDQVQDLTGRSSSDFMFPGLSTALKGATAISNYFTGAEPPKTPVTAVGKVDYGFAPAMLLEVLRWI